MTNGAAGKEYENIVIYTKGLQTKLQRFPVKVKFINGKCPWVGLGCNKNKRSRCFLLPTIAPCQYIFTKKVGKIS